MLVGHRVWVLGDSHKWRTAVVLWLARLDSVPSLRHEGVKIYGVEVGGDVGTHAIESWVLSQVRMPPETLRLIINSQTMELETGRRSDRVPSVRGRVQTTSLVGAPVTDRGDVPGLVVAQWDHEVDGARVVVTGGSNRLTPGLGLRSCSWMDLRLSSRVVGELAGVDPVRTRVPREAYAALLRQADEAAAQGTSGLVQSSK